MSVFQVTWTGWKPKQGPKDGKEGFWVVTSVRYTESCPWALDQYQVPIRPFCMAALPTPLSLSDTVPFVFPLDVHRLYPGFQAQYTIIQEIYSKLSYKRLPGPLSSTHSQPKRPSADLPPLSPSRLEAIAPQMVLFAPAFPISSSFSTVHPCFSKMKVWSCHLSASKPPMVPWHV